MQASVIFDGPQKGSSRTGISFNCHCSKMGAKTNLRLTWWFEVANHWHSTAFIYSVSFLRTCSIVLRSDKCWLQAEPTFTSNIFLNLDKVQQRNCEVVVRPVVWTKFGCTCPHVPVWCGTGCRSYDNLFSIFTWTVRFFRASMNNMLLSVFLQHSFEHPNHYFLWYGVRQRAIAMRKLEVATVRKQTAKWRL